MSYLPPGFRHPNLIRPVNQVSNDLLLVFGTPAVPEGCRTEKTRP